MSPAKAPRTRLRKRQLPSTYYTYAIALAGICVFAALLCTAVIVRADSRAIPAPISGQNLLDNALAQKRYSVRAEIRTENNNAFEAPCTRFAQAFPSVSFANLIPSTVACFLAPAIGIPNRSFVSALGTYQYSDDKGLHELTLQFFYFGEDMDAAQAFVSDGAILPSGVVRRESISALGLDGTFTYDGEPIDGHLFTHGANWMLGPGNIGILVHGDVDTPVDRAKLDALTRAIGRSVLFDERL